jgi:glycine/D-amino acid oxidase-like deaminating enzyme
VSTTQSARDAIVIGGGLHGTSTAIHLALKGLQPVVIEKNTVGRHASSVNAGGVRQLRRHPAEIPLSVAAMERWFNLDDLLGRYASMCEFVGNVGQVAVAETDEDMRGLQARAALLHDLGWTHEEPSCADWHPLCPSTASAGWFRVGTDSPRRTSPCRRSGCAHWNWASASWSRRGWWAWNTRDVGRCGPARGSTRARSW